MGFCPECGSEYSSEVVACPRCRAVLSARPVVHGGSPVMVHRVPDAAAGALLGGVLEHHGIRAVLRSAMVPGYGTVRRDWNTSAWGELLVPSEEAEEARELIADYLAALERGGAVRDEDVEDAEDAEDAAQGEL
ncbi:MAG: hypothetical protein ACRENS_00895 [Candidatus Eiseniibacteriota bacterium]